MKTPPSRFTPLAALAVAALLITVATSSHAQTPQNPIPIGTAPYIITQAGYYRLTNNINFEPGNNNAANIISVNASNVTIDFNGFYIAGPVGNPAQQVIGVRADERSNLTVLNGTIAFCYYGIYISGNGALSTNNVGARVERMRIPRCYGLGIYLQNCVAAEVVDNQINFIGGSTAVANATAYGIYTDTGSQTLTNNKISTVTGVGSGASYGIFCSSSNDTFVVGNRISLAGTGIRMTAPAPNGKYQSNLTTNCTTPFTGGTDAGLNN